MKKSLTLLFFAATIATAPLPEASPAQLLLFEALRDDVLDAHGNTRPEHVRRDEEGSIRGVYETRVNGSHVWFSATKRRDYDTCSQCSEELYDHPEADLLPEHEAREYLNLTNLGEVLEHCTLCFNGIYVTIVLEAPSTAEEVLKVKSMVERLDALARAEGQVPSLEQWFEDNSQRVQKRGCANTGFTIITINMENGTVLEIKSRLHGLLSGDVTECPIASKNLFVRYCSNHAKPFDRHMYDMPSFGISVMSADRTQYSIIFNAKCYLEKGPCGPCYHLDRLKTQTVDNDHMLALLLHIIDTAE